MPIEEGAKSPFLLQRASIKGKMTVEERTGQRELMSNQKINKFLVKVLTKEAFFV